MNRNINDTIIVYRIRNKNNHWQYLSDSAYKARWSSDYTIVKQWNSINRVYSYIKSILKFMNHNGSIYKPRVTLDDLLNNIEIVSYVISTTESNVSFDDENKKIRTIINKNIISKCL